MDDTQSSSTGDNDGHWQRAGEVFAEALELEPGEPRRRYVERATAGVAALRREVERLLDADGEAGGFLDEPACRLDGVLPEGESRLGKGEQIGPYRLLRVLGEGGMGTVYLAAREDLELRRRVALKVVRRDLVSAEIRRRFVAERQFLAELEHPNVARLYDGGTTEDGRPFLVMEAVDGEPITDYCDRRDLGVDERLKLFLDVAGAVEHAHRKLLVHRDIKPSNVLVTEDGVAKLLDFGIAKLLAGPASVKPVTATTTDVGRRLLTPSYASPEQVRGERISTATDVYSLGVLLYRLLTGASPYRPRTQLPHEMERAICEEEPRRPSRAATVSAALRRRLVGDLDTIVLKALEKRPELRYGSVEQLAEDVRRHQAGLPVRARGENTAYRAAKFLRRHRLAVCAGAVFVVLVAAFSAELGRRAEAQAQERERLARDLTDLLVEAPADVEPPAAEELLDLVVPRLRGELRDQELARAAMLDSLGRIYHQAGRGKVARQLIGESLEVRRELAAEPETASSLHDLGAVEIDRGQVERGTAFLEEALEQRRGLVGDVDVTVSESREALAIARWWQGDYAAAEQSLLGALATREKACSDPSYWMADGLSHLAALYVETGRHDEAEPLVAEAQRYRELYGESRAESAEALEDEAGLHFGRADYARSETLYRQALGLRREAVRREAVRREAVGRAGVPDGERKLATTLHHLARTLGERGAYEESKRLFSESLAIERRLDGQRNPAVATLLNNLAVVLGRAGEDAAAEALFRQVLEMRVELLGEEHPFVAQTRYSLGGLYHDRGELGAAIDLYRGAATSLARRLPAGHPALAYPQVAIGRWLLDRGRAAEAEAVLLRALEQLRSSHAEGHWRIAEAESLLGASLADQGRGAEAAQLLRRGYTVLKRQRGSDSPRTRQALARLDTLG